MRAPSSRGFTLVETLTVLAIAGVLAGMSAIALSGMKTRGNFSSATGDFLATLRTARAEAFARTNPVVVVVDMGLGKWWAVEDVAGNFSLATFSESNPAPAPDRLIYTGSMPTGITFGPLTGLGSALAPPLSGIPTGFVNITLADGGSGGTADITTDGGSAAPLLKYCSFCDPSSKIGAITFMPAGGALFSSGGSNGPPLTIGQQISMQNVVQSALSDGGANGSPTQIIDFAIVQTTGSIEAVTIR
jgi:prepilin-type N-terminal cleavage/methylation domain-containing protein